MRKLVVTVLAVGCLSLLGATLSMSVPGQVDLQAQKCDPKDPKCGGGGGTPCSPGFWKNHPDEFNAACGSVAGWTCADLLTAVSCKGNNETCRRSEAAAALNEVSGCTE